MKVAVSGSDGFVGKNVCELLKKEGHSIIPIDITQGKDLSDPEIVDEIPRIDCFIHLANLVYVPASYQEPQKYYRINYMTTLNALEICRKWGAKFVYISSYVYGPPQYIPVSEQHPICPFNPYAQTKVICEKLCEGYHRDFNIPISVIRPFNLYGEGQKGKLLIPEIIGQLHEGKDVIQLKSPHPRRDFVNVKDLARAICMCANSTKSYSVYNVCSEYSVSVEEITEIFNKYLNKKVVFRFSDSDRPNEVDETRGSYDKIKRDLGWEPQITFEEGIKQILRSENL